MERNVIKNARIGEEYTVVKHPSGLNIYIYQMKDYSLKSVLFGTKYGSINTKFKTKDDNDFITVPNGIAHYLEHKLFETEDANVFSLFAKTGASANAFTSFDKTCYLFNCTDNFYESLEILLDYVQDPYFTKENVDKERGIISQEIRMYEDVPSWRVFFGMLGCLYHNHPVKIDIAGTDETIAKIDAELLYKCYYSFYNLENMTLSIAGDVDVDKVLEICDAHLKTGTKVELETAFENEPSTICKEESVIALEVAQPLFNIGIKCEPCSGRELIKAATEFNIVNRLLCGTTSAFYKKIYDEGLINSVFDSEEFYGDGYFALVYSGESRNPRLVKDKILEEINRCKVDGLDKSEFEVIKKSLYGNMINQFTNADDISSALISWEMQGISLFDSLDVLAECTFEDITARLASINTENNVISIVEPVKTEN